MKSFVVTAAVGAALAAPGFHDAGPNLSDNGASGAWTTLYATRNPAGAESRSRRTRRFAWASSAPSESARRWARSTTSPMRSTTSSISWIATTSP